jgi:K+-sensing histidine kinase KdpD
MRFLKGAHPIVVSLSVIFAATIILWYVKLNATSSHHLVYFYLLPIVLIAVFYNGRTAVLCTAIALIGADYFLEDPIYSFVDNDLREFGDLAWFALLALTATKVVRGSMRPHAKMLEARSRYRRMPHQGSRLSQ